MAVGMRVRIVSGIASGHTGVVLDSVYNEEFSTYRLSIRLDMGAYLVCDGYQIVAL